MRQIRAKRKTNSKSLRTSVSFTKFSRLSSIKIAQSICLRKVKEMHFRILRKISKSSTPWNSMTTKGRGWINTLRGNCPNLAKTMSSLRSYSPWRSRKRLGSIAAKKKSSIKEKVQKYSKISRLLNRRTWMMSLGQNRWSKMKRTIFIGRGATINSMWSGSSTRIKKIYRQRGRSSPRRNKKLRLNSLLKST